MNQLAMSYEFKPARVEARYPSSSQTQLWTILNALKRGERLTVLTALQTYQIYALSQRCGQLKDLGWQIKSEFVPNQNGGQHKVYWL